MYFDDVDIQVITNNHDESLKVSSVLRFRPQKALFVFIRTFSWNYECIINHYDDPHNEL